MDYQQLFSAFQQHRRPGAQLLLQDWSRDDLKLHIRRNNKSILHYSCYNGWQAESTTLIEEFELDPNFEDHQNNTSLPMGCLSGNIELVKYLVSKCDPFQTNANGHSAIHIAIIAKNSSLVSLLMNTKHGRGKHSQFREKGEEIMALLFRYWNEEVAKCLICDGGCQVTMENGTTLLHVFASQGFIERVIFLITMCSCDPFQTNGNGHTVLDVAIIERNIRVVRYLVKECGCDQLCKAMGKKIMVLLFEYWDEEVARCLICDGGCQVTMENGTTLLHVFASQGFIERVIFLTTMCSCDPNVQNENGDTILHEFCHILKRRNSEDFLKRMIMFYKCDPKIENTNGETVLHIVCNSFLQSGYSRLGCRVLCFFLKECKMSPHILLNNTDKPLLHIVYEAIRHNYTNPFILHYLIVECKCYPFQTNGNGHTVLDVAIIERNIRVVRYLINECGCDQLCKAMGKKIMALLFEYWDEEVARCLICDGGCQVTMENGTTLLHEFASKGFEERLLVLIARCNCDPNVQNENGNSILHEFYSFLSSSNKEKFSFIELLILRYQCDPNIQNKNGETVLHLVCYCLLQSGYSVLGCKTLFFLLQKCKMSPHIQLNHTIHNKTSKSISSY